MQHVHNDEADSVLGTFNGLDEGSLVVASYQGIDRQFVITYFGNDVVLTLLSVPEPTTLAMPLGLAGVALVGWMRRRRS